MLEYFVRIEVVSLAVYMIAVGVVDNSASALRELDIISEVISFL